jgi:hypothetical protein
MMRTKTIVYFRKCGKESSRTVEAEPSCGEDRCAYCGACLACDTDKCLGTPNGCHVWKEYEPVDTSLRKWR